MNTIRNLVEQMDGEYLIRELEAREKGRDEAERERVKVAIAGGDEMAKEERRYDLIKQFMGPIIYSGLSPKDAAAKGLAYADAVLSALESEPKAEIVKQVKEPFFSVGALADTYLWYLADPESDCIYELPLNIFNGLTMGVVEANRRRYSTRDEAMDDFTRASRSQLGG